MKFGQIHLNPCIHILKAVVIQGREVLEDVFCRPWENVAFYRYHLWKLPSFSHLSPLYSFIGTWEPPCPSVASCLPASLPSLAGSCCCCCCWLAVTLSLKCCCCYLMHGEQARLSTGKQLWLRNYEREKDLSSSKEMIRTIWTPPSPAAALQPPIGISPVCGSWTELCPFIMKFQMRVEPGGTRWMWNQVAPGRTKWKEVEPGGTRWTQVAPGG